MPKKTPEQKPQPDVRSSLVWAVAVVLAAVVPYLPSLRGSFVLDDWFLIVNNPIAHRLAIPLAFTTRFLPSSFGTDLFYYRPLTIISFQLNYVFSGANPFAFRVTNLLLEALAALLVFWIAKRISRNVVIAGIAGIAFGVLPSHSEATAWISGRTDLLSAVFTLGSFLVFLINCHRPKGFSWPLAAACSVLLLCGLLSKEQAIVLPLLMAAYVRGQTSDGMATEKWRRDALKWCVAMAPALLVYAVLRKSAVGNGLEQNLTLLLGRRLLGVGIAYATYLRMLFVPMEPKVIYDVFPIGLRYPVLALTAWLVPVGLVVLAVRARRSLTIVAFGAAWIVIALLPVSNLLPSLGPLPAERFSYLASAGSSLILGWIAWTMLRFRPKAITVWPFVSVLLIASYFTYGAATTVAGCRSHESNLGWARAIQESDTRFADLRGLSADYFVEAGITARGSGNSALAEDCYLNAIRGYEAAITYSPRGLDYRLALAQTWRRGLTNPRKSIQVLTQAGAELGASPNLSYALALAYQDANQPENAVRELEYVIAHAQRGSALARHAAIDLSRIRLHHPRTP